jgi:hypothetical protein
MFVCLSTSHRELPADRCPTIMRFRNSSYYFGLTTHAQGWTTLNSATSKAFRVGHRVAFRHMNQLCSLKVRISPAANGAGYHLIQGHQPVVTDKVTEAKVTENRLLGNR